MMMTLRSLNDAQIFGLRLFHYQHIRPVSNGVDGGGFLAKNMLALFYGIFHMFGMKQCGLAMITISTSASHAFL